MAAARGSITEHGGHAALAPWQVGPSGGNGHWQVGPLLILFHNKIKSPEIELTAAKISTVGKNSHKICEERKFNFEQLL
jgi:hypothetical protein